MTYIIISNGELYHHGIKGMKWGVRRYQNADGSLKPAGRKRYTDYKPAIKEYRDSYDKASSMNDAADAKWRDVQDARKNLGRTAIGRTIASARNKTEAAKKYNRMYDEWSKMQDDADDQWRDADEKYKNTGGNRLTRIANNIRYDTKYGSTKSGEKKPLTDEERAARNAKIKSTAKKVAIGVGVTALVAAGTYAAVKYNNKTMAEAKQIMSDARKQAIDEFLDRAEQTRIKQSFARERYDAFADAGEHNSDAGKYWAKELNKYRADYSKNVKQMNEYDRITRANIDNKSVHREAQRALIKRDVALARRAASEKMKKALNKPTMDEIDREWADQGDRSLAAWQVRRTLGKDRETSTEKQLREMANRQAEKLKNRR